MTNLPLSSKSKIAAILVFGAIIAAVPFLIEIGNTDFDGAYYPAGRSVWESGTFQYVNNGYTYFTNLPLLAYLIAPFAAFGLDTGGDIFLAFEVITYFATFVIALRFFAKSAQDTWVLFFLFLFSRHYLTSIQFGQLTLLAFLFVILAMAAYQKEQPIAAGLFTTLAFIIKIPLGFLFLYFLYKREFRLVTASALAYIAIASLSLLIFGIQLHIDYISFAVLNNAGSTLTAYNNPSIHALVMRFLSPTGLLKWELIKIPTYLNLIVSAGLLALIIYLGSAMRGRAASLPLKRFEVSLVICVSLLLFPIVWDHYYLFLIFPFFVAYESIRDEEKKPLHLIGIWIASLVLVNLPVLSLIDAQAGVIPLISGLVSNHVIRSLIPSTPLFGNILLLSVLAMQYRRYVAGDAEHDSPHTTSPAMDPVSPDPSGLPALRSTE